MLAGNFILNILFYRMVAHIELVLLILMREHEATCPMILNLFQQSFYEDIGLSATIARYRETEAGQKAACTTQAFLKTMVRL